MLRKLRGMSILFQEEMRRDARPAGESSAPRSDGRTEVPRTTLASLHQQLDVTYATYEDPTNSGAGRSLQLDLYRPKQAWGQLPAIVCIHGGGWAKGNRTSHGKLAQALAARGYVTATISYRLSGEAPFPAAIHDCKAAVRFLRANAKEYGIDSQRIGAIGLSAGGHLTALLATSAGVAELEGEGGHKDISSAIQAAMPMGAQTDLLSDRTRTISANAQRGGIWRQFLGGTLEAQPKRYQLASPLQHLDKTDPPMWFMTGENDDPSTHADVFRASAEEVGIPTRLTIIPNAPHPFLGRQVWFDQMIETADQFFTTHLKRNEGGKAKNKGRR